MVPVSDISENGALGSGCGQRDSLVVVNYSWLAIARRVCCVHGGKSGKSPWILVDYYFCCCLIADIEPTLKEKIQNKAMAEGEDDDYMSDKFLVESKDTKPKQLAWGKAAHQHKMEARRKEAAEKNRSKFKPMKVREEEQRQKGLNSAISTESKGFAMLQKMGYKQGSGLGKTGSGRAEPVGIEIKTGRGGLGQETEQKRKQEEMAKMREAMVHKRARMEVHRRGNFLQQMSERFSEKEVEKDLYNSQKACAHLDQMEGYSEPEVIWYWPKKLQPEYEDDEQEEEDDEEEEEDDLSMTDKLGELTNYLRTQHRYCVWCGTTFNDDKDLQENCPGDNADVHR